MKQYKYIKERIRPGSIARYIAENDEFNKMKQESVTKKLRKRRLRDSNVEELLNYALKELGWWNNEPIEEVDTYDNLKDNK